MKLPALPRVSRAELLFSAKSFAAAMLAMFVASRAGLPRPFWAMLTSYVVAAPLAGNVRSKALFRFCGTLIGCTATVLMVPALASAPELLTLALALWVGGCLYLSLHDRTARAYVFMLAGYTAALIGFPSVETPLALFDNAIARVEEIGLGILCGTLAHSLVLPVGMGPTLLAVLDRGLGDARQWFADVLGRTAPAADRQRLAGDITQLRLLSTHVPFDTSHLRWTAGAVGAMQDALAALTPALSAVEDRLQALQEAEGALAPDVTAVLEATARWLRDEAVSTDRDAALLASLHALGADASCGTPWTRALRIGLAVRLEELVHGWRDCETLRRDIDAGLAGAAPRRRTASLGNRVLHKDTGLALLSSFAAVLAICLCGAFWIATAWPSGSAAAMMAAVFCSFFATMDDPVPAINNFMRFTLWSAPVSALYVLVLLPLVHDFGMLVLVCAPTFGVLGCFAGRPATAPSAMAMIFGIAGTLSMHDTQVVVDLPGFLNSTLAQVLGIFAAALVTRLVRTVGADWTAQRIRRATWSELGALADAPRGARVDDAYA
ncbi:MAG TPA: FUSC family protein, partial [Burkholderiaceae bacterium]